MRTEADVLAELRQARDDLRRAEERQHDAEVARLDECVDELEGELADLRA